MLLILDDPESPLEVLSALSNGLVLGIPPMLRRRRPLGWLAGLVTGATALNLYWAIKLISYGENPLIALGIGYWAWVASFACMAAALRLRDRERKSARVKEVVA